MRVLRGYALPKVQHRMELDNPCASFTMLELTEKKFMILKIVVDKGVGFA